MGRYDILVSDAEHKFKLAKIRQGVLRARLDIAIRNLERAEKKYYEASSKYCEYESTIRSLSQKLSWQKRKNNH